ncbi:MAG: MFS transporter [Actinomycetota bacterium]
MTPAFGLVGLATLVYFAAIGTLLPVFPRYVRGPLRGGNLLVGLAVGSFSFGALVLRPWVGRLGDRRGRRLLLMVGAAVVSLSLVGYVIATTLALLILFRVLGGLGEALFFVGAASAITDLAPDRRRAEAMSLFSLAVFGGLSVGPMLGEAVLAGSGFRSVWLAAAAGAMIAAAVSLAVPETRPASPRTKAPLADDLASASSRPRLLHPAALLPGGVLLASVAGLTAFNAFVPLYALEIGLAGSRFVFLTFSVIALSIRSLGARLPDRLGVVRSARIALACSTAGLATIALWRGPEGLFAGAAVFSLGQALAFPALMSLAMRGAPDAERGAVVSTFTGFFDLAYGAGALGLGAVAALLGYRGSFLAAASLAAAGLLVLRRCAK